MSSLIDRTLQILLFRKQTNYAPRIRFSAASHCIAPLQPSRRLISTLRSLAHFLLIKALERIPLRCVFLFFLFICYKLAFLFICDKLERFSAAPIEALLSMEEI